MTPHPTREALDRLAELLKAATPGPWQAKNEHEWDEIIGNIDGPDAGQFHYTHICSADMLEVRTAEQRANAALIVAAVNALPALLALAADAERYRFLRDDATWTLTVGSDGCRLGCYLPGVTISAIGPDADEFDAAIDTARQGAARGEGVGDA